VLGGPAAVDVVAHLALQAVGHVEDHADQAVGRDLHARRAHDPGLLIFSESGGKIAVGLIRT